MAKATSAQGIEVLRMIERGDYDREMVQAIIDKRIVISPYRVIPATDAYQTYADKVEGKDLKLHHFRITVESAVLPTYADLIANYGEGNVSTLWDVRERKIELHESLRELPPRTGEVTVFVKKFDRPTSSEKAIKWADEHNYRLVLPWEREAFSKANPDLQRKFWIVDLGSSVSNSLGGGYVPLLRGDDAGRCLVGDDSFDEELDAAHRFLFASK